MTPDEFWLMVNKTDDCWLWTGTATAGGYGQIRLNRKHKYAHRHAYELTVGLIPNGLVIDHLCRVTLCVRPDHLEAVTQRENVLRGTAPAAQYARRDRCGYGHLYTESNIYMDNGGRRCRECRLKRSKERYARAKVLKGRKLLSAEQIADVQARFIPGRNRYERGNGAELAIEFGVSAATIRSMAALATGLLEVKP